MKSISYTRHWSFNESEEVKGSLTSLLLDYPYSFSYTDQIGNSQLIPSFDYINELLKSGGNDGGMSPGCTWESIHISKEDYIKLTKELTELNLELIKDKHPYAPQKLILDKELNNKFLNNKEWEKEAILKYKGVHEFIEFFGDDKPILYNENIKVGDITIYAQSKGSVYFGKLNYYNKESNIGGRRVLFPRIFKQIKMWEKNYQNLFELKWFRLKKPSKLKVLDSWGRKTELVYFFISDKRFISFKSKFERIDI